MPSVAEALAAKPPLAAALAQGVKTLSMDQTLHFNLYQRYVFPLDGMNYWVKVPTAVGSVTTPGIQLIPGLATATVKDGESIQVCPGSFGAMVIAGGVIVNPLEAVDQGLPEAESLFVDLSGAAYSYVTGTTKELQPGESFTIPANPTNGAWVTSASRNHNFTCVLQKTVPSVTVPTDLDVQGSFHYTSAIEQREDATVDTNEVIFTALSEVQEFNQIGPDYLYICTFDDPPIRFAFSSRGRLYQQADLYHYLGKAIYSVNDTQVIDDMNEFNPELVVSNSLPIWLYLQNYVPPYPGFRCTFPLYPSFLVDDNLVPPFGSVHIEETTNIGMAPFFDMMSNSRYLSREKVRIHLYGVSSRGAEDFCACIMQYSRDWMTLGLSSVPNVKDGKHTQSELKTIAQYKIVELDINYNQETIRNISRQFIEHCIVQNQAKWLTDAI